jgi:hypothetical protein
MPAAKPICPRCNRTLTVQHPAPEVQCICHLYCDMGSSPEDCCMQVYNYTGSLSYPVGMNNDSQEMLDGNPLKYAQYCTIHNRYSTKVPIIIEVDWKQWLNQKRLKTNQKETASQW